MDPLLRNAQIRHLFRTRDRPGQRVSFRRPGWSLSPSKIVALTSEFHTKGAQILIWAGLTWRGD